MYNYIVLSTLLGMERLRGKGLALQNRLRGKMLNAEQDKAGDSAAEAVHPLVGKTLVHEDGEEFNVVEIKKGTHDNFIARLSSVKERKFINKGLPVLEQDLKDPRQKWRLKGG